MFRVARGTHTTTHIGGAMTTQPLQQVPSVCLYELAFACYIYEPMSNADEAYKEFMEATKPRPDLSKAEHRTALVKWLNKWGCRQFAKDDHELASDEIRDWYREFSTFLSPSKTLLELSDADFDSVRTAYESLAGRRASKRNKRNGGQSDVKIGPTGTAKILFAVRPQALMPWDGFIRNKFGLDGLADSYIVFLKQAKTRLEELGEICARNGHALSELPALANRCDSTLVKLIDEYLWVTITNECKAPTNQVLEQWAEWAHWI